MSHAVSDFLDRKREVARSGRRDVEADWDLNVSILPWDGRIYGLFFTDRPEMRDLLRAQEWFEPFAYWDSTDRPDDLDDAEWQRRCDIWDGILAQDPAGRPSGCGLSADLASGRAFPALELIHANLPSFESRVAWIARNRVVAAVHEAARSRLTDDEWKASAMQLTIKALSWLETTDGKAKLEAEEAEVSGLIPRELGHADLAA